MSTETTVLQTTGCATAPTREALEQLRAEAVRRAQLSDPHSAEGARRRAAIGPIEAELARLAEPRQLTLDGREVTAPASPPAPLTPAQRAILQLARERERISPAEAGAILHAHRDPPCPRCALGSCAFTSTDGHDALGRLADRGFVRRIGRGTWALTDAEGTSTAGHAAADRPARGPKGARVGDVIVAERSRWRVTDLDPARGEAICTLLAGSHAIRRFRARRIERVERAPRSRRARRSAASSERAAA